MHRRLRRLLQAHSTPPSSASSATPSRICSPGPSSTSSTPTTTRSTLAALARLREGGDIIAFENRYRCRDGCYRWLLWTAAPFVDQGLIYAAARDITERKATEETLAHERNLLRTLMDNLPDHIFVKDTASRFVTANAATLRRLGPRSLAEVVGKTRLRLPAGASRPSSISGDEQEVLRTGEAAGQPRGDARSTAGGRALAA